MWWDDRPGVWAAGRARPRGMARSHADTPGHTTNGSDGILLWRTSCHRAADGAIARASARSAPEVLTRNAARLIAHHHERNLRMVKVRRNVSGCFRAPVGEEAAEQDGVKSASAFMYAGRRAAWLRRLRRLRRRGRRSRSPSRASRGARRARASRGASAGAPRPARRAGRSGWGGRGRRAACHWRGGGGRGGWGGGEGGGWGGGGRGGGGGGGGGRRAARS